MVDRLMVLSVMLELSMVEFCSLVRFTMVWLSEILVSVELNTCPPVTSESRIVLLMIVVFSARDLLMIELMISLVLNELFCAELPINRDEVMLEFTMPDEFIVEESAAPLVSVVLSMVLFCIEPLVMVLRSILLVLMTVFMEVILTSIESVMLPLLMTLSLMMLSEITPR